jgi:hypothetical protein
VIRINLTAKSLLNIPFTLVRVAFIAAELDFSPSMIGCIFPVQDNANRNVLKLLLLGNLSRFTLTACLKQHHPFCKQMVNFLFLSLEEKHIKESS